MTNDLPHLDVAAAWARCAPCRVLDKLMGADRIKHLDSVVHGLLFRARKALHEGAQAEGRTVVALSDPRWLQHADDALHFAAYETGSSSQTTRPWEPGTPLAEGFSHLTVELRGVSIPLIKLKG